MFPFKMRSLTKSIDDEIHRAVRQQAPGKYLAFRSAEVFARIGFGIGVVTLVVYCLMSFIARIQGDLQESDVAAIVQVCGYIIAAGVSLGVIGSLVYEVLLKDLEVIARSAISRVLAK